MLEFLFLCVTTPNELQCMVVGVVPGLQIVHCHMLLQKLTDLLQPAKDLTSVRIPMYVLIVLIHVVMDVQEHTCIAAVSSVFQAVPEQRW